MSGHTDHIRQIDAKITALSAALADLGKGTSLRDLLKIIHNPGWTTPAEASLVVTLVDGLAAQVATIANTQTALVAAAKHVGVKTQVAA